MMSATTWAVCNHHSVRSEPDHTKRMELINTLMEEKVKKEAQGSVDTLLNNNVFTIKYIVEEIVESWFAYESNTEEDLIATIQVLHESPWNECKLELDGVSNGLTFRDLIRVYEQIRGYTEATHFEAELKHQLALRVRTQITQYNEQQKEE